MKILIAEDDPVSRKVLESYLKQWDHKVVATTDGTEALEKLTEDEAPNLAILDWMMPGIDGIDVCRKIREREAGPFIYIIMLTARGNKEDIAAGFDAGADDFVTKPFDKNELRHRIRAGERIVKLQLVLEQKLADLNKSLAQLRQLHNLLPVCPVCNTNRNDTQYMNQLKKYISMRKVEELIGSLCPSCRVALGVDYNMGNEVPTK